MSSCCCFVITPQGAAGILETVGGRFDDVVGPGCSCLNPCSARFAGTVSLRDEVITCDAEGISADRAQVRLRICVIYRAIPSEVHRAYYSMANATNQVRSFVVSTLRSLLPSKTLDEIFMTRSEISGAVRAHLSVQLAQLGFEIVSVLVTDVNVRGQVRESMNQQVTQRYLRVVEQLRGEIAKTLRVAVAEGNAEADRLRGVGVAMERQAIASAFREGLSSGAASVAAAHAGGDHRETARAVAAMVSTVGSGAVEAATEQEMMALMLMIQYFDLLGDLARGQRVHPKTYILPYASAFDSEGNLNRKTFMQRLRERAAMSGANGSGGEYTSAPAAAAAAMRDDDL